MIMNAEPMLTIIVPVYGIREDYLCRCVESLLDQIPTRDPDREQGQLPNLDHGRNTRQIPGQERRDFRVILVDDGSDDGCGAACDAFAVRDGRVLSIHQRNAGVSAARNLGLSLAGTDWICFVDADDWVEPDYARTLCRELSGRAARADVLLLDYVREQKNGGRVLRPGIPEGEVRGGTLDAVRKSTYYKLRIGGKESPYDMIVLWNKAYRRRFLKERGVWFVPEARKGQDRLFNADALLGASRVFYAGCALYHYRCLEESRTNRYDPQIPALTRIELRSLREILERRGMPDRAKEYLDYRISTRLYACLRLYCFHPSNPAPLREKLRQAARLSESEPFAEAVRVVDLRLLNRQERLFVRCIRKKHYGLVFFLVRAKSAATGAGLRQAPVRVRS